MRLDRLVDALPGARLGSSSARVLPSIEVTAITSDSRQVAPGSLFVAYPGVQADGHAFIARAVAAGAVAVVGERELGALGCAAPGLVHPSRLGDAAVPYIVVPNGREALAHLHAAWHGFPARALKMIGVTGTDGKTTVANLLLSILRAAGRLAGMICTVSAHIGAEMHDTGLHTTTPDAPEVQALLADMAAAGCEYAVLETTSHGLAQHRVAACDFDVAVVTNITHEHLDFHGTREAYVAAKAMLFENLHGGYRKPGVAKVAILNRDDSSFERLRDIPADAQISYGLGDSADVRAMDVQYTPRSSRFVVQLRLPESMQQESAVDVETPLIGEYNVYNCLAAMAGALSQSLDVTAIQSGIASMTGVVGRMERIDEGQDFLAIVDFAHTPRALEVALQTARRLTEGRVIVVFGSAGLRDVDKRQWMGRIAGQLADQVIITAEDPRTESLEAIMAEIAMGCLAVGQREGHDYWRVADRAEAISLAVAMATAGDVVIVTGKGHERSMCFGATEYPWSDHAAVRAALRGEPLPDSLTLPSAEAGPQMG